MKLLPGRINKEVAEVQKVSQCGEGAFLPPTHQNRIKEPFRRCLYNVISLCQLFGHCPGGKEKTAAGGLSTLTFTEDVFSSTTWGGKLTCIKLIAKEV